MTNTRRADPGAVRPRRNLRRSIVLETAKDAGLLVGASSRIAGRIRKPLIDAAKARSGIKSDTELLEYVCENEKDLEHMPFKQNATQGR